MAASIVYVTATRRADGCLLSLAIDQKAVLVSGDNHVLALAGDFPIYSPAGFPRLIGGPEG